MLVLLYFYARFYLMRTFLAFFFGFTFLFGSVHSQRPLLVDPLNGSVHGIGQIALRWQYSACGTFDLEWDTDSLFQTSQSVQTSRRDTLLPISTPNTYFIRVRCAGNGLFSTAAKFQVVDFGTLGNLKLWLNADSGLVLESGRVAAWKNWADTAQVMIQGSSALRPRWDSAGFLGRPSIRFGQDGLPGQATWLDLPGPLLIDSFSFFWACQQLSTQNLVQFFLSGNVSGFFSGGTFGGYNMGVTDGISNRVNVAPQNLAPRIICQTENAFFQNGSIVPSNVNGSALNPITFYTLGKRTDNNNLFANNQCPELLLYNTELSQQNRILLTDYLRFKYSPRLNLPYDTQACASSIVLNLDLPSPIGQVLWSNGQTGPQGLFTTSGTHWVRVTNPLGVVLTDTFQIRGIFPAPLVTESGIKPLCLGDTLSQVYMNPDPIQPWQWNTGSTSDTLKITRPGQYWLLQTDSSGCVLSSDTLEVINRVDSEIALSLAGCSGDTSLFSAQAGDLLGSPIVFYDWDFGPNGSLDTLHLAQAATVFSQPGPQTIRLIAYNSLGCPDTTALTIQVPGSPTAQFSQPHACAGTPMPLSNQSVIPSGTNVSSYRWEYWNGQSSNLVGPLLHFSDTGMYPMALKVFLANGCSDSIQSNIHVFRKVNAHFVLPFDSLCQFAPLPLSDASTYLNSSPGQAVWGLGSAQADTGFALQLNPGESGLLPLRLSVKSAEGCVDSLQKQVWVNATPQADIGLSQQLGFPPLAISVWDASDKSYPARNFGLNGQQFWSDSLLSLNLTDTGLYRFSLLVTDNLGCRDSSTKNLRLIRPELSTEIKNLRCEKKGSLYAPDFELQNSSVLLPIQKESFDFWVENSATMRWEDSVLVPPGLTIGFQSKGSLNAPKSPRFCCVKPVSLISEYAPGLFLNVSGETTCAALVDPFFLADVQPNPSRGEVLVRFHLSAPGKVSWRVIGGDGKSALVGEGDYAAGMQQFSIPAKTLAQGSYSLVMTQGDNAGVSKFIVLE